MRRLLCSLLAALMLLPWVMQGAWAAGGTREVKSREIAVVFDNSGSMYDAGNTAWCGAGYAVEVFAAMMNEKDRLSVYPMWPVEAGGKKYSSSSPLTVTPADDLSVIRDMYTPEAWNTPIETITAASQGLASSQADEKWLIVLTDGDTFFENGESMNGSKTEERLEEELTRCNAAENVMYLGIGSVAVMPKVSAGKNVYYADKATTTAEILTKLTAMSNMIFGRDELKLSGDTLEFDLPMSKLILFVQGSGVGDVTLTGSEGKQLNAVSQYAPSYGTRGAGLDYAGVCAADTSLQGVVATYEDCDAGVWLARLSDELLDMVDKKKIGLVQGVDISFLTEQAQEWVQVILEETGAAISTTQSSKLKEYGKNGELTLPMVRLILTEEKPKERKVTIKADKISRYFTEDYSSEDIENIIYQLLEEWNTGKATNKQ